MIKLDNVKVVYNNKYDKVIGIDNVNLEFNSYGFILIKGVSGSGKSTLLNVISGNLDYSGNIYLDNKLASKNDLFNRVSYVSQDVNLINELNVLENIKLVLKGKNNNNIDTVLEKLNIKSLKRKKTKLLSGGERQRVAIARAILEDSSVILCDEVTSGLDYENTKIILNFLKELSKDHLILFSTHEEINLNDVDVFMEIDDGKIIRNETYNKTHSLKTKTKRRKSVGFLTQFKLANIYLFKNLINIFLVLISLFFFIYEINTLFSINNLDRETIINNSMIENNENYLYLDQKIINLENGKQTGMNITENDIHILNNYVDYYIDVYDMKNGQSPHYFKPITRYIKIDERIVNTFNFNVYGRLPDKENEIALPILMFYNLQDISINNNGIYYSIKEYNDLIGKYITIGDKNYNIVGIVDTKFPYYIYKDVKDNSDKSIYYNDYKFFDPVHNAIYTNEHLENNSGYRCKMIDNKPTNFKKIFGDFQLQDNFSKIKYANKELNDTSKIYFKEGYKFDGKLHKDEIVIPLTAIIKKIDSNNLTKEEFNNKVKSIFELNQNVAVYKKFYFKHEFFGNRSFNIVGYSYDCYDYDKDGDTFYISEEEYDYLFNNEYYLKPRKLIIPTSKENNILKIKELFEKRTYVNEFFVENQFVESIDSYFNLNNRYIKSYDENISIVLKNKYRTTIINYFLVISTFVFLTLSVIKMIQSSLKNVVLLKNLGYKYFSVLIPYLVLIPFVLLTLLIGSTFAYNNIDKLNLEIINNSVMLFKPYSFNLNFSIISNITILLVVLGLLLVISYVYYKRTNNKLLNNFE